MNVLYILLIVISGFIISDSIQKQIEFVSSVP